MGLIRNQSILVNSGKHDHWDGRGSNPFKTFLSLFQLPDESNESSVQSRLRCTDLDVYFMEEKTVLLGKEV